MNLNLRQSVLKFKRQLMRKFLLFLVTGFSINSENLFAQTPGYPAKQNIRFFYSICMGSISSFKFNEIEVIIFAAALIAAIGFSAVLYIHFRKNNIFRELYKSQESFKTTLYSIGDAVITTDNKGKVQYLNAVAEKLTGWKESEARGKELENVFNIINEYSRKNVENPIRKVLSEGMIVGLANHTLLISKDGNEIPISDSGAPIIDETGKIIGVVLVFRDQTEERNTQKLITDSETKYRRIFESAKDGILIIDADSFVIIDVNPELPEILGGVKEDFIGHNFRELKLSNKIKDSVTEYEKILLHDKIHIDEVELINENDKCVFFEIVGNSYLSNNKKVIQFNIRDITERKEAIKKSNYLASIVQSSEDAIIGKDLNGIITSWNKGAEKLYGYTENEMLGRSITALLHKGNKTEIPSILARLKKGEIIDHYETKRITKYGKELIVSLSVSPITDSNGKIIAASSIARDITEAKQVREKIEQSEKFLKETQKIARLGSYVLDVNTGIWTSSEILDSIFGINFNYPKSIEGWTKIIHPEWQQIMADYFTNEIIGNKKPFNKEYKIIRLNDNSERWVHGMGELTLDVNGNPIQLIGTIRDVTERKENELEIERLNRVYALLSNINQTIVRTQIKEKLFVDICRIAIQDGKFRMAFIGLVNKESNKVEIAASAGVVKDYLEKLNIDLNDKVRAQGPVGRAILTGVHQLSDDIQNDEKMIPWRDDAERLGYKSIASFPLFLYGEVIGVITLYSDQKQFYQPQEIKLLDEMAMDISFALQFIENDLQRTEAEEKLRSSEKLLRLAGQTAKLGGWSLNLSEDKIVWSDEVAYIHEVEQGYSPTLAEGINFYAPEYRDKISSVFSECATAGKPYDVEMEIITGKGNRVWVRAIGNPEYDSLGNITGVRGSFQDISEKKIAEENLRESEKRFRMLFDEAPLGYQSLDSNGNFIDVNRKWLNSLGYKPEEVIGKWFGDFLMPEYRGAFKERFQIFKAQGSIHSEFEMVHKDGYPLIIAFEGKIGKDNSGNFKQTHCILEDITETRNTEKALRASEAKYRKLFDEDLTGDYISTPEGKILLCNDAFVDILKGPGKDEIMRKNASNLYFDNADRDNFIKELTVKKKLINKETSLRAFDGSRITVIENVIGTFDENGKLTEISGYMFDITDRKNMEEALIKSRREFQTYFENSMVGLGVTTSDKKWLQMNQRLCDILGYSKEELQNLTWLDVTHPDDIEESNILFNQVVQGKIERYKQDKRFIRKDGEIVHISLSTVCQRRDDGTIQNFITSYSDITERKMAEDEIRKLYRGVEQSPASVLITDVKGKIEYVNKKFCETSGYSYNEIIGKNPNLLRSDEKSPTDYAEMWNTILAGKDWQGEFLNKKKNGELFWESVSISPILNEKGEITHFIGIKEDITEKKKMIDELIQAKEKAEEMNRIKTNFLSNMSHELRTPLVGILGYADFLRSEVDSDEIKEMIETIYNSGKRLSETLNLILDLSQFENNKRNFEIYKIDLVAKANEVISLFKRKCKEKRN